MNVRATGVGRDSTTDFLSASSFWLPDDNVASAWIGHAPFAFWLVEALKPRSIVELGVHTGFSYLVFCQAVRQLGLSSFCCGIDTWRGDEHSGFYGEEVYEQLCRDHHRYLGFSRLIRSTFADAQSQISDGSIDLLHIDGCHHYDTVQRDFETWKPKLSSRAIVLFHDICEPTFGVGEFWGELRGKYRHFEFPHAHGLGVLGFGADLPAKIEYLFGMSEVVSASQSIRSAYARLGNAVVDRQTVKRLERLVQQQTMQIETYARSTSWRVTAPLRAFAKRTSAFWGGREIALVPQLVAQDQYQCDGPPLAAQMR